MKLKTDPRYRKRVPCRVWVGKSSYSGMILNLSRMGLFVQTNAGVTSGDAIELKFNGGDPLHAQVVWRRRRNGAADSPPPPGMGMRFLEIDGATARRLEEFVFEYSLQQLSAGAEGLS